MRGADVLQQLTLPLLLGVSLLSGAACGNSVTPSPTGAGGDGAGATGAGGSGGSTDGGSGGTGGTAAGALPLACTPPDVGCDAGEKCSIVDETLGIPDGLGCVEAGSRLVWEPCDADVVCAAGLWCDYTTAVCKPMCGVAELGCTTSDACVVGRDSAGLPIAGLSVCLAACNPLASSDKPCADDADVTCFYRADEGAFDCGQGSNKPWPNSCTSHLECAYGLGCVGGSCVDWCPTLGSECSGTKGDGTWYCESFSPCGTCTDSGLTHDGAPLGACL